MVRCIQVLGLACLAGVLVPSANGQTVQLPSYQWFSVNTSVMAPDRGSAYLGGVNRSSSGSRQFGTPGAGKIPGLGRLFGDRAYGGSSGASGTSVHVTVIDHEALDRAVLAEAGRRRGASYGTFSPAVSRLSEALSTSAASAASQEQGGLMSVAEIRRLNAQRNAARYEEARRLAAQGRQAEEKGSLGAAKIFYQMAYRRADTELQKQLAVRLNKLAQGKTTQGKTTQGKTSQVESSRR